MNNNKEFRDYASEVILEKNTWVDELGLRKPMLEYFHHGRQGYGFPRSISIFQNLAWRLLILNLWSRFYGLSS